MLTLGLSGGLDAVHEQAFDTPSNYTYDGAAVLLEDGAVVAAVEEERVNRIKHSSKLPMQAIDRCLRSRGVRLSDVDRIAYYVDEDSANELLSRFRLARPDLVPQGDARTLFSQLLGRAFDCQLAPGTLRFFAHKLTHAMPAMAQSGFAESLVYVIDNAGGVFAGSRDAKGTVALTPVMATTPAMSIQRLFHAVFPFLGLGLFDEYKAMALAPYGDPATYASVVEPLYELRPDGRYLLHLDRAGGLMGNIEPRHPGEDFTQAHKDLAASLQRAMEDIVLHVLAHHRHATGIERVCLAGGMAENSSTNARVIYARLFRDVFVHPAAYDAGCALGAALLAAQETGPSPAARVQGVAWGTDIGDAADISARLSRWDGFINVEQDDKIERTAAQCLAKGDAIGWVQGRAEFGSHALGHRAALADPRRPDASARLARALRRSTAYRPFGVAVLEEEAERLFDLPGGPASFRFTAAAARVRHAARCLLPAGIHVDGTVRLQTVARTAVPHYWALLRSFQELTGVPALLTASLNTELEPTADSVDDAAVTFLASDLDALVVGSCIVLRSTPAWQHRLGLLVSLPPYVEVLRMRRGGPLTSRLHHELRTSYDPPRRRTVSAELGEALAALGRATPAGEVLGAYPHARQVELMTELETLWTERLITLAPAGAAEGVLR